MSNQFKDVTYVTIPDFSLEEIKEITSHQNLDDIIVRVRIFT